MTKPNNPGRNAAKSLGARGRQDAHLFFPEDLTLIVGPNCDAEVRSLAAKNLLNIIEDPGHFLYDQRADMPVDRDLSESLIKDGVIQPIRIMRDGDRKVIVVGRQRVKSAALANGRIPDETQRVRLPALIYRSDEAKAFKTLIVENEMRVGDAPCMRAAKMQGCRDRGMDDEEICRIFRIGKPQLKNMISLLDCDPTVRKAVDSSIITPSLAYTELVKLGRKEQVETLAALKAAGITRGASAKEAVAAYRDATKEGKQAPTPERKRTPRKREIEAWIEKLKGQEDPLLKGVRMGLMRTLGTSPKGWSAVKEVIEKG